MPAAAPVFTYDYHDATGALVFQACAMEDGRIRHRFIEANEWRWGLGAADPIPYNLPGVIEACALGRPVVVAPDEESADALIGVGVTATTIAGGLLKWTDAYAEIFRGGAVVLMGAGSFADTIAAACHAAGATVRVVAVPDDDREVTREEVDRLIDAAKVWKPDRSRKTLWSLRELLADEELMRPPAAVVPRLAYQGRSTLLSAPPKAGKSTKAGYLAAQVSTGGSFLGHPCNSGQPGNVLIVGLEESMGDTARRLHEFGADADRVHLVTHFLGAHNATATGDRDGLTPLEEVRRHIESVAPALVVIDTLMAYCGHAVTDANAASQMQPIVQPLTNLAHDTGAALVILHHSKKSGGGFANSYIIGGGVDVIAEIDTPDEANDPTLRQARVVGRGGVGRHTFGFRYDERAKTYLSDSGASTSLADRIKFYIGSHPGCSLRAIRSGVGGASGDVDAMLKRMVATGEVENARGTTGNSFRLPNYVIHR